MLGEVKWKGYYIEQAELAVSSIYGI